jgi:YHS domain-containing protein
MKKSMSAPQVFIDPVCFTEVDPGRNDLMLTYKMCTYHFCNETCRRTFKTNPEQYLGDSPKKRKGFWGRYLERLSKTTGGKPLKCH